MGPFWGSHFFLHYNFILRLCNTPTNKAHFWQNKSYLRVWILFWWHFEVKKAKSRKILVLPSRHRYHLCIQAFSPETSRGFPKFRNLKGRFIQKIGHFYEFKSYFGDILKWKKQNHAEFLSCLLDIGINYVYKSFHKKQAKVFFNVVI